MPHRRWRGALAAMIIPVLGLFAGPVAAESGKILDIQSPWQAHLAYRSSTVFRTADGGLDREGGGPDIEPAGEGWAQPDFDDRGWEAHSGPMLPGTSHAVGHGQGENPRTSQIFLRGRFRVENPAQVRQMHLSARYRGGMIVHLNGHEVLRRHVDDGQVSADTLAEDYTDREAAPNPSDAASGAQAAQIRLRSIDDAPIATEHLRSGINVLAIHLLNAALPPEANQKHTHRKQWATVGLQEISLLASPASAVAGNLGEPVGVQVWTALPIADLETTRPDAAQLAEGIAPIRLTAARNTTVSGQAIISSATPVTGVRARLSAFTGDAGPLNLPDDAVQVRYPARTIDGMSYSMDRPDVLVAEPTGREPVQPVWVTVNVPADAAPGAYRATLQVEADGLARPASVPVELVIHAWDCPDPQEWRSMVSMIQSAHSVAWQYGVDMWSPRHLELLQPSLSMMRALGNNVLYIDVIHPTFFANEHGIIVFQRQGQRLVPDFTYFERYLDAYAEHVGEPRRINLVLWEPHVENDASGVTVSVRSSNGRLEHARAPMYGTAGAAEVWKPLMDGVRQRVLDRGWDERAIMLGVGHDRRPNAQIVGFFNEIAPYARWMIFTHGRGDPQIRDGQVSFGNMPVGLQEYPYYAVGRAGRLHQGLQRGWVNDWYDSMIIWAGRMMLNDNSPPAQFRLFPNAHVIGRSQGFCRQGIDKWPVVNPHHPDRGARRMVHGTGGWGNLYRHKVRSIAAPGPDGALPTVRFEMMRQGLQDTEARIYLERALVNPASREVLGDEFEAAVKALVLAESDTRDTRSGNTLTPGTDWESRNQRLYELAAEAQEKLRAAGLEQ